MYSPCRLNYIQHGSRRNPAFLFLHGFMGSGADWGEVMKHFCDQHLCIAVDLPGHGRSVAGCSKTSYEMGNCALSIISLMDELKLNQCYLAGYSMGGRLAFYLAVHFPQRFTKVVIESATPGLKTQQERQERICHDQEVARHLEAVSLKQFVTKWYDQPLFASLKNESKRFQRLCQSRLNNDKAGLTLSLRMMGTGVQPSLWDELDEVKVPLLLMVGEKDGKFRAIGREIAARCKAAHIAVVKDAGHNVHFENLQQYLKQVSLFLNPNFASIAYHLSLPGGEGHH